MINFKELKFMPPPPMQDKKITLNLKQIATPPPAPKPQPRPQPPVQAQKPTPVVPPPVVPKPVIEKKPEPKQEEPRKEKVLDLSTKRFAEKSTKENNVTKPKKKKIVKKKVVKKKKIVKKRTKPKKRRIAQRSKDPLANFLRGSTKSFKYTKSPKRKSRSRARASSGSYGEHMIQNLYGPEFNSFTPTQKKFIRNNLSTIHRITQNTLTRNGYPSVAVRTQQQGTNIVSFYLHPNGDISRLKLKTPIGYASLDQNTLEVIRIAYKDYPLPNKKTKIVFYVSYRLY